MRVAVKCDFMSLLMNRADKFRMLLGDLSQYEEGTLDPAIAEEIENFVSDCRITRSRVRRRVVIFLIQRECGGH